MDITLSASLSAEASVSSLLSLSSDTLPMDKHSELTLEYISPRFWACLSCRTTELSSGSDTWCSTYHLSFIWINSQSWHSSTSLEDFEPVYLVTQLNFRLVQKKNEKMKEKNDALSVLSSLSFSSDTLGVFSLFDTLSVPSPLSLEHSVSTVPLFDKLSHFTCARRATMSFNTSMFSSPPIPPP